VGSATRLHALVIGKFSPDDFALHVAETLSSLGHEVRRFEPGVRDGRAGGRLAHRLLQARGAIHSATDGVPAVRALRIRRLWELAEQGALDLVILCHDYLWPREVDELKRRTGARVVLWMPDSFTYFGRGFFMNAAYDAAFFKDPYIVHCMREILRFPVYYLPECFSPEKHSLPADAAGHDAAYRCDITTAGNQHSWRVALLSKLTDYDVKIWGSPPALWMVRGLVDGMYQGRGVYNHDKARAFRGAKIVLNYLHYGEIWGVNVRCFEAAGAGAFQMMDWRPAVGQLFEIGKELITFSGFTDMKEKIEYWLPRDDERRSIAEAGMRRAHEEHTYALRLGLLLDTVAGKAKGYPVPEVGYTLK
jgi:spore maturation protein CgeB